MRCIVWWRGGLGIRYVRCETGELELKQGGGEVGWGRMRMRANRPQYQPGPNSTFMHPASNPNHYTDLLAEIETAPTRSTWDRVKNRLAGVFRFE